MVQSKSVRFSTDDEEIKRENQSLASSERVVTSYKPVEEHSLTPCPSNIEMTYKAPPGSFAETLLLRLLDDINRGRLSHADLLTLASYSMDVIQSAVHLTSLAGPESDMVVGEEAQCLVDSSSSLLASKMVDFTLDKILGDIRSGHVHQDDLASLTLSLLDNVSGTMSRSSVTLPYTDGDDLAEDSTRVNTVIGQRDISPVSDSILDEFVINTLQDLLYDLQNESISTDQMKALAHTVKNKTDSLMLDDYNMRDKGILNILQDLLEDLKSGCADPTFIPHIVLSIVQAYEEMKSPLWTPFENKASDMIKYVLKVFESKAADLEIKDLDKLQTVNAKIAQHTFGQRQLDHLTPYILKLTDDQDMDASPHNDLQVLEDALLAASESLENGKADQRLCNHLETLVDVISVDMSYDESPVLVEVFVNVLTHLKTMIENFKVVEESSIEHINNLIANVAARTVSPGEIFELASSVVQAIQSPVKSDSSFAACFAVTHSLKEVLDDLSNGSLEDIQIEGIVEALRKCSIVSKLRNTSSPLLMSSLTSLFRTVLGKLAFQLESGTVTTKDVVEIADTLNEKVLHEVDPDKIEGSHILLYIYHLLEDIAGGELSHDEVTNIGQALMDCGQRLLEEHESTEEDSDPGYIETRIMEIENEIRNADTSNALLKQVVKEIISQTSITSIPAITTIKYDIENQVSEKTTYRGIPMTLIHFVRDVLIQMQHELLNESISYQAVAHFCQTVTGESEERDPENAAADNLEMIIHEVESCDNVLYVERVLNTYLFPNQSVGALMDPVKAVESISLSISSNILREFVITALQTVLMEMRDDSANLHTNPTSVYVLRSAATLVAENLVKHVLEVVKKDITANVYKHLTRKEKIERAIAGLLTKLPDEVPSVELNTNITQSTELEDVVLETFHNVVSNAIFEQASETDTSTHTRDAVKDVALGAMQTVIEDQQDKRVNLTIGAVDDNMQMHGEEKKDALTYISKMINKEIADMKKEILERAEPTASKMGESNSGQIQAIILEHLRRALSTSEPPNEALSLNQRKDVTSILEESVKRTIDNIKGHMFESEDLSTLFKTASRIVGEYDIHGEQGAAVSEEDVLVMMEDVLVMIQQHDLDEAVLHDISVQLATLGMECPNGVTASDDVSPSSTVILGLVTDVLTRMTKSLKEELKDMENNNNLETDSEQNVDESGRISRSTRSQNMLREGASSRASKVSWASNTVKSSSPRSKDKQQMNHKSGSPKSPRSPKRRTNQVKVNLSPGKTSKPKQSEKGKSSDRVTQPTPNLKSPQERTVKEGHTTDVVKHKVKTSHNMIRTKSYTAPRRSPTMRYKSSYLSKTPTPGPEEPRKPKPKPNKSPADVKARAVKKEPVKHVIFPRKRLETKRECEADSSRVPYIQTSSVNIKVTDRSPIKRVKSPKKRRDNTFKTSDESFNNITEKSQTKEVKSQVEIEKAKYLKADDVRDDVIHVDLTPPCATHKMEVVFRREARP